MGPLRLGMGFGEQCELYTWMDYRNVSRDTTSEEQRQKREKDKEDFLWSFRPIWAWSDYGDDFEKTKTLEFIKEHRLDWVMIFPSDRNDPVEILKEAVRRDRLIVVIERRSYGGSNEPRPRSITFTPSQLFRGAARMAGSIGASAPALPRLPAEDGIAIWLAKPGDVLPDGTIATPVSTPLGDAQPFEYTPDTLGDHATDLAARGVSEAEETDCFGEYEFDLEQCDFVKAMTQDPRAYALCKQTAFQNYQRCRGF